MQITLGSKVFATSKTKRALEYIEGADIKSAIMFVLARQAFQSFEKR